jgi:Uma2 family endonuclease
VVSPGDSPREVHAKVSDWLNAGAIEVRVADPQRRSISVHQASAPPRVHHLRDELIAGDLLPGFRPSLEPLFAPCRA